MNGVLPDFGIDTFNPVSGETSGSVAKMLLTNGMDVGCLRPYLDKKGRACITRNVFDPSSGTVKPKKVLVRNDNATLRFLDWIQLDEAIIKAAKPRLRAAADLRQAGLVYQLPNGIAKTVMQFQQQSDITPATISMDGLRQGERDRPVFSLLNFPLPLIHKDFSFPLRQVLESRTGYSPLDITTAELAGRRVAEQVEQLTLGVTSSLLTGNDTYRFGGGTVYGYMNFPNRITYTITLPTAGGWTPSTTINDVLMMIKICKQAFHFGPWMMYCGLNWDPYMDADYKPTYNSDTLRRRLRMIDGIIDVRTLDYIPDYSLLLVQQTADVARMVIGLDFTTVQWETSGGWELNFKVICLMVPQLRTDINLNTGLVHGNG